MLDRLSRDGCPEIARRCDSFVGAPSRGAPSLLSRSLREEGGDSDFHPGQAFTCGCRVCVITRLVALGIVFLEVVEQATPLADQHEKAAARAVVFLVRLEVLRQLANTLAEQCDLNFGLPVSLGCVPYWSMRDFFCSLANTKLVHSCLLVSIYPGDVIEDITRS
jgi:hypothetical protein